ncbi:hypothetical protein PFISCL1PPCAC_5228, partial [Pristionchus fissidentatus]
LYFHGRSVWLLWKYKVLHSNILIILSNFYVNFQAGSVSRLVTIVFETRLIHLPTLGSAPLPLLGVIRSASLTHAFCLL